MRAYSLYISTAVMLILAARAELTAATPGADLDKLVGQPADIASSAYQYRADRKPEENPPESWLALMRYANQPLNKPVDVERAGDQAGLVRVTLGGNPPARTIGVDLGRRCPAPACAEDVVITTLDNRGTASSWWNNLVAARKSVKPAVSADGTTYVYDLETPTCGLVISVSGAKAPRTSTSPRCARWWRTPGRRWTSRSSGGSIGPLPARTTAGGSKPMTASWPDCAPGRRRRHHGG